MRLGDSTTHAGAPSCGPGRAQPSARAASLAVVTTDRPASTPTDRGRRWRPEYGDWLLTALGVGWSLLTVIVERKPLQRLADVEVPNGLMILLVALALAGQRMRRRAFATLSQPMTELGEAVGARMRQNDARSQQLLDLQASVERLTRWLVRLTVVLGVIGITGIAATIVAAAA